MPDDGVLGGKTPTEACKAFLEEMGTSTHVMQQGFSTTIMTVLARQELVDYLHRLADTVAEKLDSQNMDDVLHVEFVETPDGSVRTASILDVPVH